MISRLRAPGVACTTLIAQILISRPACSGDSVFGLRGSMPSVAKLGHSPLGIRSRVSDLGDIHGAQAAHSTRFVGSHSRTQQIRDRNGRNDRNCTEVIGAAAARFADRVLVAKTLTTAGVISFELCVSSAPSPAQSFAAVKQRWQPGPDITSRKLPENDLAELLPNVLDFAEVFRPPYAGAPLRQRFRGWTQGLKWQSQWLR